MKRYCSVDVSVDSSLKNYVRSIVTKKKKSNISYSYSYFIDLTI